MWKHFISFALNQNKNLTHFTFTCFHFHFFSILMKCSQFPFFKIYTQHNILVTVPHLRIVTVNGYKNLLTKHDKFEGKRKKFILCFRTPSLLQPTVAIHMIYRMAPRYATQVFLVVYNRKKELQLQKILFIKT